MTGFAAWIRSPSKSGAGSRERWSPAFLPPGECYRLAQASPGLRACFSMLAQTDAGKLSEMHLGCCSPKCEISTRI